MALLLTKLFIKPATTKPATIMAPWSVLNRLTLTACSALMAITAAGVQAEPVQVVNADGSITTIISESPPSSITEDEDELDDTSYYTNLLARNQVTTDVEFLGVGLMGETIDPYSGSLSFQVTDVAIPGNSAIPVNLSRSISRGSEGGNLLGDWVKG